MRSELLQRIQTLLQNEDLEAIRKDVRTDIDSFRSLIQEDFRAQREAWEKEEQGSRAVIEISQVCLLRIVYPNIVKLSRNSVDTTSRAPA